MTPAPVAASVGSSSPVKASTHVKISTKDAVDTDALTAEMGRRHMVKTEDALADECTEAQIKHFIAKEKGMNDWMKYQDIVEVSDEIKQIGVFVKELIKMSFNNAKEFEFAMRDTRKICKISPSKPEIVRAYAKLREIDEVPKHAIFEQLSVKKNIRSNSGVVVITLLTAPGTFSCPEDCHYCPNEPGQPRSYLSTEPAVARATQNEFCPVRQFYDRASTLAKQGHVVDKIEIIVLGGTWSGYPADYQEAFCRDIFYAANSFSDSLGVKSGKKLTDLIDLRPRLSVEEEQKINETAEVKIIGLTLETRPDHINRPELRKLRRFGCTRVQIGVQHTDNNILKYINRGHKIEAAIKAVKLLKESGFKVDIHLMPDLPSSDPEKDWKMFEYVLYSEHLQADHWKVYPCEVVPFSKIEKWYAEGSYIPYTEKDPMLLTNLLVYLKARVHPWIRLNRVIRDIPEVSIIAGNMNTNLRQVIFAELKRLGQCCRCIRCREVRDWPESEDHLFIKIRQYRSSEGTEYFISVEGAERGSGGGATQRALGGGEKMSKKRMKKLQLKEAEMAAKQQEASPSTGPTDEERLSDNTTLYGLLRLRLNDDGGVSAAKSFKELGGCALIRELHVYGFLKAAQRKETEDPNQPAPQHRSIGKTLMQVAEIISKRQGYTKTSVIAGVGVREYYKKQGYVLTPPGNYLIKDLTVPSLYPPMEKQTKDTLKSVEDLEVPFLEASQWVDGSYNGNSSYFKRKEERERKEKITNITFATIIAGMGLIMWLKSR